MIFFICNTDQILNYPNINILGSEKYFKVKTTMLEPLPVTFCGSRLIFRSLFSSAMGFLDCFQRFDWFFTLIPGIL